MRPDPAPSFASSFMSSHRPAVRFVLACVLLDALGIGLIIPVLPRLIGTLTNSPDEQTLWYGAVMVSYGLMQFFFAPLIGALSDRIGRRPVLLAGISGLALMMIVPAVTTSVELLLLSRIAGGALSSNIVVAQAYIADVTPADRRTAAFGRIGAIFGIAFVLGPALGGLLGEYDPRLPFAVAAIICFLNFLYGLFVLPESLTTPDKTPIPWRRMHPFGALTELGRERALVPALVIVVLYTLSQSVVQCTWALYTEFRYGWTPQAIGFSIFALGLSITLTQGWLLPKATRRLSPKQIVTIGLLVGLLALLGMGLSTSGPVAAALMCAFALMGIVGPTVQGLVSRTGDATRQGVRMGAVSSLNSFTGAVSPLIGTPLIFYAGRQDPSALAAGLPYFLAALLLVAALLTALASKLDDGAS